MNPTLKEFLGNRPKVEEKFPSGQPEADLAEKFWRTELKNVNLCCNFLFIGLGSELPSIYTKKVLLHWSRYCAEAWHGVDENVGRWLKFPDGTSDGFDVVEDAGTCLAVNDCDQTWIEDDKDFSLCKTYQAYDAALPKHIFKNNFQRLTIVLFSTIATCWHCIWRFRKL